MSDHLFLDESKHRRYIVAVAVVPAAQVSATRKAVQALAMPGQARVHFQTESAARRRVILAALVVRGVRVRIYDAGSRGGGEAPARRSCLAAVVEDAAATGAHMLVLELDDSWLQWDNGQLLELRRAAECVDHLRYEHHRSSAEPLLWIADAVAWCWARGGEWHRLVRPLIEDVREV